MPGAQPGHPIVDPAMDTGIPQHRFRVRFTGAIQAENEVFTVLCPTLKPVFGVIHQLA